MVSKRVAPLNFTSETGYYGLRVNPTLDQVIGTVRKPLGIPVPQRTAKWYALSPYRALILDAEKKYNDYEIAGLEYKNSGAELPEAAARVRPSDAAHDDTFDQIDRHHERTREHAAYEQAFDLFNQEAQARTNAHRTEQLRSAHGVNLTHPVVEAAHDELLEAGVPHHMPAPREAMPRRVWHTPPEQFAAAGHPQAPEFTDFRVLNMGDPASVRATTLTPSENRTYEQLRTSVVGPTWSS